MTLTDYQSFIAAKKARVNEVGPGVDLTAINPTLHAWQAEIVPVGNRRWSGSHLGRYGPR
jgi:hypothetical protein